MRKVLALTVLVLLSGCGNPEAETDEQMTAEAEGRTMETPAAYDPDTLAWVQEGRTVEFGDREWLPAGVPINAPTMVPVGEFEGMELYAPADETAPYDRLFFHVGGDDWQMLEPTEPVPDTPAM